MDCASFTNGLDSWLDGDLGDREAAAMEGHAASCGSCGLEAARERELRALLQAQPLPEAQEGFLERLPALVVDRVLPGGPFASPAGIPAARVAPRRPVSRRTVSRRWIDAAVLAACTAAALAVVALRPAPPAPEAPGVPAPALPAQGPARPAEVEAPPAPARPAGPDRTAVEAAFAALASADPAGLEEFLNPLRNLGRERDLMVMRGLDSKKDEVVAGALLAAEKLPVPGAVHRIQRLLEADRHAKQALRTLASLDRGRAVSAAVRMLASPEGRKVALGEIPGLCDPRFAAPLAAILLEKDPDPAVIDCLVSTGPEGVEALEKELRQPEARRALAALRALGALRSSSSAGIVVERGFARRELRDEALRVVGELGSGDAVPALLDLMSNRTFADKAAAAVAALGESAVAPLERELRLAGPGRARDAVFLLGHVRSPSAAPPLAFALSRSHLRREAVIALGRTGRAEAVEPLLAALSDRELAAEAAQALGSLGDSRALKPLIELLRDKELAKAAACALGELGDREAVPALLQTLEGGLAEAEAIRAAARLGDPRAIPALINALRYGRTKKEAHRALVDLVGEDQGSEFLHWARWWKNRPSEPERDAYGSKDPVRLVLSQGSPDPVSKEESHVF